MVVSAERQKIRKKHSSTGEWDIEIPLFIVPFIISVLLFSVFVNFLNLIWNNEEPNFNISGITLPEENRREGDTEGVILKAEAPNLFPVKPVEQNSSELRGVSISEYRIRENDSYSIIAGKFGITLDTIVSLNAIQESDSAEVGDILQIADQSGILHTVEKGDTLLSLSQKFKCEIEDIVETNNLMSSLIKTGEELFIPGASLPDGEMKRIIGDRFLIPAEGTVKNNYGTYIDPVTGLKNYNYGIDIINKKGTAVYAAKEGIIGNTSFNAYYGRVIQVNHSGEMQSIYSCLDSIVVKPGEPVERGELLGYMGSSGFRAGEHLQFSIFEKKEDVDTLEFIF